MPVKQNMLILKHVLQCFALFILATAADSRGVAYMGHGSGKHILSGKNKPIIVKQLNNNMGKRQHNIIQVWRRNFLKYLRKCQYLPKNTFIQNKDNMLIWP